MEGSEHLLSHGSQTLRPTCLEVSSGAHCTGTSSLKLPGPQPSSLMPWELGSNTMGWGRGQLIVTQLRAFPGDESRHGLGAAATLPPSSKACKGRSHPMVGWPHASVAGCSSSSHRGSRSQDTRTSKETWERDKATLSSTPAGWFLL